MSIQINKLTHIYMRGTIFEKKALDEISLTIEDGEFVGIIGHTGSGKSTLIQHLKGILKPSLGEVIIDGNNATVKNSVGILFQNPEHQLFEDTVYDDIAYGLKKSGRDKKLIDEKVKEFADYLGIDDEILYKSPFELSWGQKKLVAMAGVLVLEPKILVLDEPFAGLDARGRDMFFKLILKFFKSRNLTVILVSHSMEEVIRFADRVIVMDRGKIKMDGWAKEIFNYTKELKSIGLDVPEITHFMERLKEIIPDLKENILTVKEAKKELKNFLEK
ncbi:energy-coupling factor transporter ATPase [Herbivorax sp. ANBcel31]|uniref:energy-coupling factor transporter ATPase n=1 Tax=Herbivorax sp. ANBcel31 TaxID=3069754 RepID=UPI0027B05E41|nr:energy-coupling factor transporter ATPase [Herbivorax sp. ANBcel31]MDQ2087614.1 energy-coupling factor transporter ATPase [Herbivorax sp. ANBcel31]